MERKARWIPVSVLLVSVVMLMLATCGTEDDPYCFFCRSGGENYNYDDIAVGSSDPAMRDFYLDWEEEVYEDSL